MAERLRVGVIGLGRRWPAYRRALLRLAKQFEIRCVCDVVAARAAAEARLLRCAAAGGVVDLVGRDDVDAVVLAGRAWWGLWPVEQACREGKPVFCDVSPAADDAHADDIAEEVRSRGAPVLMAHPLAAAGALGRLQTLLRDHLGRAHCVRAELSLPAARNPAADLLRAPAVGPLLSTCVGLLGARPVTMWASGAGAVASVVMEVEQGRAAVVSVAAGAVAACCRLQVFAENGVATAHLPHTVRWRDAEGRHTHRLQPVAAEETLLERFAQALRSGDPVRPGFTDAHEAFGWLRAAWRSRDEGRRVGLDEMTPATSGRQ
jgi:predicted dehydrogenase